MVRLTVDVDNAHAGEALSALSARLTDLTPVMEAIAVRLEASTAGRFETATGPDGKAWKKSIRAKKESGLTLTDTARLRRSITTRVTPHSAEVGTNVEYAAIHQFGGEIRRKARKQVLAFDGAGRFAARKNTRKRKAGAIPVAIADIGAHTITMPARPFLGVDAADRASILKIIARTLEEAV